jgi:hypothetical protein
VSDTDLPSARQSIGVGQVAEGNEGLVALKVGRKNDRLSEMKRLKASGPTLNLRLRMEGIYKGTEGRETGSKERE